MTFTAVSMLGGVEAKATTSSQVLWNGPICQTCMTPYLGTHRCTRPALMARINELMLMLPDAPEDDSGPINP